MQYIWHLAECACAWMQWIQWHSAIHNQLQQRSDWAVSLRRGSISFQWQLVLLSSFCIACHAIVWSGSVIGSKNRYDTDKWMYMEYTSFFLRTGWETLPQLIAGEVVQIYSAKCQQDIIEVGHTYCWINHGAGCHGRDKLCVLTRGRLRTKLINASKTVHSTSVGHPMMMAGNGIVIFSSFKVMVSEAPAVPVTWNTWLMIFLKYE